jgi:acetyltransferase-like isoleucine patch superfamily enzyme
LLPPSRFKNALLNRFGHSVAPTAVLWPSLVVNVERFEIGEYARIGLLNVVRNLTHARFEDYSRLESWNWISAHPDFRRLDPKAGTLFLGVCSRIGSRCYVDCSGTVIVRHYSYVGGTNCTLQSHQPDYGTDCQSIGRITVGHHSFVGSRAVMLKGAFLPECSLLAANSTLAHSSTPDGKPGLYAGSPAIWKRETKGDWFVRKTYAMKAELVDGTMGILPEDVTPLEFTTTPVDVAPSWHINCDSPVSKLPEH